MRSRYVALLVAVLALAAGLSVLARVAPRGPAGPRGGTAPAPVPETALSLDLRDGTLAPESAQVPKDHRVRLTVTNRGRAPARLVLGGYEDRLSVPRIPPGSSWSGAFLADRPGEDFAWMLDGRPAGRLTVTGSHLVEGHQ